MSLKINKEWIVLSAEVRMAFFLFLLFGFYIFLFPEKKPVVIEVEKYQFPTSSQEIISGDKNKKQIIFTFDGGDSSLSGLKILSVLEKHGVKGTFFLTGKFVERNPFLVKKMYDNGHEIYNHTYDHPYLTLVSDDQIKKELWDMDRILRATIGKSTKPYFRAPYGDRDERVLKQAFDAGYQSVYWTVDALDWKEREGETDDTVRDRILSTLAPGNIYLMHIGDNITGNILDELFTTIESKGYKLVSLKQGL